METICVFNHVSLTIFLVSKTLRSKQWFIHFLLVCFSVLAVATSAFSLVLPEIEKLNDQGNLQQILALKQESLAEGKENQKFLKKKGQTLGCRN